MGNRKEFTGKTKAAAFAQCGGKCEGCGHEFQDGERVEFDHAVPDALRKNNSLDNCQVLCAPCHLAKTRGDITTIAKAKRIERKQAGTWRQPRAIIPGSKAHYLSKSVRGRIIKRSTGEIIRESR